MTKISTTTEYIELEGDYGPVDGVEVTCGECGHSETSFGTGAGSLNRCALLLRENCPRGEQNLYDASE
ncbi:conserved hypothetical protein [Rhodospirillaceae bacterium LM-1]|nr:conserved hypothetical protein [Rhodospirillaceae bacterium LM-1]